MARLWRESGIHGISLIKMTLAGSAPSGWGPHLLKRGVWLLPPPITWVGELKTMGENPELCMSKHMG